METNNKLSKLMSPSEPVRICQQKENHAPHEVRKYLKKIRIGAYPNGDIVLFININDRDVYVPVPGYHTCLYLLLPLQIKISTTARFEKSPAESTKQNPF